MAHLEVSRAMEQRPCSGPSRRLSILGEYIGVIKGRLYRGYIGVI